MNAHFLRSRLVKSWIQIDLAPGAGETDHLVTAGCSKKIFEPTHPTRGYNCILILLGLRYSITFPGYRHWTRTGVATAVLRYGMELGSFFLRFISPLLAHHP